MWPDLNTDLAEPFAPCGISVLAQVHLTGPGLWSSSPVVLQVWSPEQEHQHHQEPIDANSQPWSYWIINSEGRRGAIHVGISAPGGSDTLTATTCQYCLITIPICFSLFKPLYPEIKTNVETSKFIKKLGKRALKTAERWGLVEHWKLVECGWVESRQDNNLGSRGQWH